MILLARTQIHKFTNDCFPHLKMFFTFNTVLCVFVCSGGGGLMRLDRLVRSPELLLEPLLWLSAADGLAWTGSWLHLNWWRKLLFLGCLVLPLTWDVRVVLELWILEDLSDGPDGHHFVLELFPATLVYGSSQKWCHFSETTWLIDWLIDWSLHYH